MINTLKKMMVGLVGASFLIGAMVPVSAAPVMPSAPVASNENVQSVRDDRWRRPGGDRHWRGDRRGPRPGWRGDGPRPG